MRKASLLFHPIRFTLASCCLVLSFALHAVRSEAQEAGQTKTKTSFPSSDMRAERNPDIARIVRQIDARNIERIIRKLVSFGTRNTLSAQNDPARGIGAARDWLYSELMKAAEKSGGRMTVEKQSYEQQKAARIPTPTVITNVVATLRGAQSESEDRIYVVSGHYDSMCGSATDAKCDAPGPLSKRKRLKRLILARLTKTALALADAPIGKNYVIPEGVEFILAVVCSSYREWIPTKNNRYWMYEDIPRVCTPEELMELVSRLNSGQLPSSNRIPIQPRVRS